MLTWALEERVLPLNFTWKISRNSSDEKKNFFVRVADKNIFAVGEIAPNVRYGESEELIKEQFNKFVSSYTPEKSTTLDKLEKYLDSLDLAHSLRFGIESAFVHLECETRGIHPAEYFKLKMPEYVATCFSVPIIPVEEIKDFIEPLKRFESLKIKVNKDTALDMVMEVAKNTNQKLRIDGNEAWSDINELLKFIEKIKHLPVEFIEQPMPAHLVDEYRFLKRNSPFDLIADESIEDKADFKLIAEQFHGVNMKLMKAGGYKNGLNLLNQARKHKLKTMIGCMVETSLGIYSAFNLSNKVDYLDLDGFMIIKSDPYRLIIEENGCLYLS